MRLHNCHRASGIKHSSSIHLRLILRRIAVLGRETPESLVDLDGFGEACEWLGLVLALAGSMSEVLLDSVHGPPDVLALVLWASRLEDGVGADGGRMCAVTKFEGFRGEFELLADVELGLGHLDNAIAEESHALDDVFARLDDRVLCCLLVQVEDANHGAGDAWICNHEPVGADLAPESC